MVSAHPVRQFATHVAALGSLAYAFTGCTSEEPQDCGPSSRQEAQTANQAFFDEYATEKGYRDGITGHGVSENEQGWFIVALVSPGEMDSTDRPSCFDGVPVEYETGGPFTGN